MTQTNLIQQTIGTGTTNGGASARTLTSYGVNYGAGDKGWYMNLPTSGERVVSSAMARGDNVYFSTIIPGSDACTFGGTSWLMVADMQTGGAPANAAIDIDGDGIVDEFDEISDPATPDDPDDDMRHAEDSLITSAEDQGDRLYMGSSDGNIVDITAEHLGERTRTGRLSWEELIRQ